MRSAPARHPSLRAAALVGGGFALYLLIRGILVGRGNLSRLALIGTVFSERAELPGYLVQVPGTGYDGQFFLRLALDPFNLHQVAFGITMNGDYRFQRIVYPLLGWLLSGGDGHLVPLALLVINVAAVATIAATAAALARDTAHPTLVGVLVGGYFGYTLSAGRDLAEPTAAALAILGMYLFEHRHLVAASVLLMLAALTLETELVIPVAIGVVWLVGTLTKRRIAFNPIVFLLPGAAWLGYQALLEALLGHIAIRSDLRGNLGIPLVTVVRGIEAHLRLLDTTHLIWFGQLAVLTLFVALAATSLRSPLVPTYLKVAWGFMLALTLSLSGEVWNHSSYFRAIDLLWMTSVLIWARSRPRWWWPAACGVIATVVSSIPLLAFL
jgi:hypothetical protein